MNLLVNCWVEEISQIHSSDVERCSDEDFQSQQEIIITVNVGGKFAVHHR